MDDRPRHPDEEHEEGFEIFGASGDPDDSSLGESSEQLFEAYEAQEPVAVELPHWTDPPTGEVPRILDTGDDDLRAWSTLGSSQPRWRDQSRDWDDSDLSALGEDLPPAAPRQELAGSDDFFTFDDAEAPPDTYSIPRDPAEPYGGRSVDPFTEAQPAGSRDMVSAVGVGVGLGAIALILLNIGAAAAMALVVAVLTLASAELHATLRRVGYTPPSLIGLAAAAALPLAAYWRGEPGIVLALVLTMVVGLMWYLLDVGGELAVPNLGVTMLGVVYVGVLGSFAALLLRAPDGVGLLLAAVIGTIAYDIAGLVVGRSLGRSPLSAASPNKTVEGTVGGMVFAVLATVVVVGGMIGNGIAPFDSVGDALVLGLVLAVAAPVADLCESLLKRDLGVKDMGSILPGHGGLLDRFDTMLFALPATYYVAWFVLWT